MIALGVRRGTGLGGAAALLAGLVLMFAAGSARAVEIQRVISQKGIEAWLVEERSIPLITVKFSFRGGSVNDPAGMTGSVSMLSGMLDEGAGDLDSSAFQARIKELSVRMSFSAGRDRFSGTFQTLSENRDAAFALLRLVLREPRFDKPALDRVRAQVLAGLKRDAEDPRRIAGRSWMALAFGDHVYSRPQKGTPDDIANITGDSLRRLARDLFRRDGLKIAVVGDIDAKTLKGMLDRVFGDLPEKSALRTPPDTQVKKGPILKIVEMNVPQTVIQFGTVGIKRKDRDFIPAYVLNYILGGGGFSSRLYGEIREKRGLVYSVYSYLYPLERAALFIGGAATKNENVAETVALIRSEIDRLAKEGPSEKELRDAKTYLTGSYALRFDTSGKIAGQLLGIQVENLGLDYITRRNGLIRAVTLEDVRRVARRFLRSDNLIFTLVGKPVGVTPVNVGG